MNEARDTLKLDGVDFYIHAGDPDLPGKYVLVFRPETSDMLDMVNMDRSKFVKNLTKLLNSGTKMRWREDGDYGGLSFSTMDMVDHIKKLVM